MNGKKGLHHEMADPSSSSPESLRVNLEPMKGVSALMRKIGRRILEIVGVAAVSGAAAHEAGDYVQDSFRGVTHYSPVRNEAREAPRRLLDRLITTAKESLSQLFGILAFLDKAAYWGPFSVIFLGLMMTLSKIISIKRQIMEQIPPPVARNIEAVGKKHNDAMAVLDAMATRLQALEARVRAQGTTAPPPEEARVLLVEAQEVADKILALPAGGQEGVIIDLDAQGELLPVEGNTDKTSKVKLEEKS